MYNHVVVGTDGSPTATMAVEAAARLAQTHDARLTIVHAFKPGAVTIGVDEDLREFSWRRSAGTIADEVVKAAARHAQAAAGGGLDIGTRPELGRPVAVLLAVIADLNPDAVVVGNADVRRLRVHRSIGHALSRKVSSDIVVVDTSRAA